MSAQSKLAPGFRFRPTDEELVKYYLVNWILAQDIPYQGIQFFDIYGHEEPWQIWNRVDLQDTEFLYVFTKLKSKGGNRGSRTDRTTGTSGGCWHGEDSGDPFNVEMDDGHSLACLKKKFSYKNKTENVLGEHQRYRWVMNEYSCSLSNEHVLCRIRRKERDDLKRKNRESTSHTKLEIQNTMQEPATVVPPGFRFDPTQEELLGYYLFNKITKEEAPFRGTIVRECDLYGEEEPWQIWERFEKAYAEDLYFFTNLKKQKPGGSRICRRVGSGGKGTWHGEDAGSKINVRIKIGESRSRVITGSKKRYNYQNPESSHHGRWIMYEYSSPSLSDEIVLSVLRNNGAAGDDLRITAEPVETTSANSEDMREAITAKEELGETQRNGPKQIKKPTGSDDADSEETEDEEPKFKLRSFQLQNVPKEWLSLHSSSSREGIDSAATLAAESVPHKKRHKFKYHR